MTQHFRAFVGSASLYVEADSSSRAESVVVEWAEEHGYSQFVENGMISLECVSSQEFYNHYNYPRIEDILIRART